jgi:hypothetical protein
MGSVSEARGTSRGWGRGVAAATTSLVVVRVAPSVCR